MRECWLAGVEPANLRVSVQISAVAPEETDVMEHDRFKGRWKFVGGVIRESWGRLISDPDVADEGRRLQRAGRVQERQGRNKEQARRQLDEFMRRNRRWHISGR